MSSISEQAIECMREFKSKLKASGNPPGRIECPAGGKLALLELDAFNGNLCRTELTEPMGASAFKVLANVAPKPFSKSYSPASEIAKARNAARVSK